MKDIRRERVDRVYMFPQNEQTCRTVRMLYEVATARLSLYIAHDSETVLLALVRLIREC